MIENCSNVCVEFWRKGCALPKLDGSNELVEVASILASDCHSQPEICRDTSEDGCWHILVCSGQEFEPRTCIADDEIYSFCIRDKF